MKIPSDRIYWLAHATTLFGSISVQTEKAPLRKDLVLGTELKLFICWWLGTEEGNPFPTLDC